MSAKRVAIRFCGASAAWLAVAAGCAPGSRQPAPVAPQCAAVATAVDTLSVAAKLTTLPGEYRLVAVVDSGAGAGRAGHAGLGVWRADDGRVLAATTLDLHALVAPSMSDLASRSDSRPGLTLRGRRLVVVPIDAQPSSETEFVIEEISSAGFAGRWSSRAGRFVMPLNGVPLEDTAGHFCADRR